jgi:hypothetical protein
MPLDAKGANLNPRGSNGNISAFNYQPGAPQDPQLLNEMRETINV